MSTVLALVYYLAVIRRHAFSALETALRACDSGLALDLLGHPVSSDSPLDLECGHFG